jgi:hypothetical protein
MPPGTRVRPASIPGEVLRHGYEVRTLDDVDRYLVGLKTWLIRSIDERPAGALEHIRRYVTDVDRLLDARGRLMGLG